MNTLKIAKRMQDAGMSPQQSEALANVLDEEVHGDLVTSVELGASVDRLETKIDALEERLESKIDALEGRLEAKIDAVEGRLEAKIDNSLVRMENTMWKVGFAILGGTLAVGGLLLRFVR
jgi:DNA-binding transcriptional MerR regulator